MKENIFYSDLYDAACFMDSEDDDYADDIIGKFKSVDLYSYMQKDLKQIEDYGYYGTPTDQTELFDIACNRYVEIINKDRKEMTDMTEDEFYAVYQVLTSRSNKEIEELKKEGYYQILLGK